MTIDRYAIERIILDTLERHADSPVTATASDYLLGSSGARIDLAVVADEFLGFAIAGSDDRLDGIAAALPVYARYFDRVAVVVAPCHLPALRSAVLSGAALWSVTDDGELAEHVAGTPNLVGPAALFDLMPLEARHELLRPLLPKGAYDRSNPPLSLTDVRAHAGQLRTSVAVQFRAA